MYTCIKLCVLLDVGLVSHTIISCTINMRDNMIVTVVLHYNMCSRRDQIYDTCIYYMKC